MKLETKLNNESLKHLVNLPRMVKIFCCQVIMIQHDSFHAMACWFLLSFRHLNAVQVQHTQVELAVNIEEGCDGRTMVDVVKIFGVLTLSNVVSPSIALFDYFKSAAKYRDKYMQIIQNLKVCLCKLNPGLFKENARHRQLFCFKFSI